MKSAHLNMDTIALYGTATLSGVVIHSFFRLFELDTYPVTIFLAFVAAPFGVKYILNGHVPEVTFGTSILVVGWSILSLWTSMLVYRAFFHPLRHFPGPRLAKLSKFWALWQTARSDSKWYQVVEKLHRKYGDYVRTGELDPERRNQLLD